MSEYVFNYMPTISIILCILFVVVAYIMIFRCTFCLKRLTQEDKMINGRVRYRKIGTNLPVCKSCANKRYSEVE